MKKRAILAVASTLTWLANAPAQSITIQNSGFELPAIAPGTFSTNAPPPGWSAYGPLNFGNRTIGVLNPASTQLYPGGAPQGANVGVVFLMDDFANQTVFTNQGAGLRQTLATPLATSTHYVLRVRIGNLGNDPTPPHSSFQFAGFPGYRVDLLAGSTLLASDTDSLLPSEGAFLESTVTFTTGSSHALAGQPLAIRLVNRNAAPGIEVNFDDVRLAAFPAAVWTDLGAGKPGVAGIPELVGIGPLIVGTSNQLVLTGAAPSTVAHLVFGFSAIHAPFLGGTLVPSPQIVLPLPTSPSGSLSLPFSWPTSLPSGTSLYFHYWIADPTATLGVAASNALSAITP